jgi:spoIIIJ-associated protein
MSNETRTDTDDEVGTANDELDDQLDALPDDRTDDQADDQAGDHAGDQADEEPRDLDEVSGAPDAGDTDDADDSEDEEHVGALEREGDVAADYLEELLDIADLDGDLDMDVDGDRAAVSIVGADLSQLVGQRGEVLDALQELTRLAVYRETGERSRLMLDISEYRAGQRIRLVELARASVAQPERFLGPGFT